MRDEQDGQDGDLMPVHQIDGPDRSPREVERLVVSVAVTSPLDDLIAALDAADWLAARSKAVHHLSRQIAIAWIERNGEFDLGEMHYRVGYNSVTKCINPKQAALQLLDDCWTIWEATSRPSWISSFPNL